MSLYGYGFDRRRHPRAVPWHALLDAAAGPEEVVTAVRDYLALLTPTEIARLPVACRPGRIVDAEDVNEYAFVLAQQRFRREARPDTTFQKLSAFMNSASLRLSRLVTPPRSATDLQ